MLRELHHYRVKPAKSYGERRRIVLQALLDESPTPRLVPHIKLTYADFDVVCYNPQKLQFHLAWAISGIQSIHGRAETIEVVECENDKF